MGLPFEIRGPAELRGQAEAMARRLSGAARPNAARIDWEQP
jgi:hypothetical protein